jgi:hypothetical protein
VTGVVNDFTGQIIAGAVVRLYSDSNRYLTRTAGRGEFSFEEIQPGSYTLEASSLGFKTFRIPDLRIREGEVRRIPDIPLVLAGFCGLPAFNYILSEGDLSTAAGEVAYLPYGSTQGVNYSGHISVVGANGSVIAVSAASKDSRFVIRDLPPGTYRMLFEVRNGRLLHEEIVRIRQGWNLDIGTIDIWETCPDGGCDESHPPRYRICE